MSDKPKFRIMKNGYDRFAVDNVISQYEKEILDLKRKLELYSAKLEQSSLLMEELRSRYVSLNATLNTKEQLAENISRMALQEANSIISSAQENADMIVKESLAISRMIFTDLAKLTNSIKDMKDDVKGKLDNLYIDVEEFKFPDLPDLRWLEEAEKKMH
ncbi:MAG: hypothetical protein GX675_06385 [Erysipelotrichaceae bacterium]|nr:hypothetical protein [Erysipelotrichaceae bacterium]